MINILQIFSNPFSYMKIFEIQLSFLRTDSKSTFQILAWCDSVVECDVQLFDVLLK